MGSVGISVMPNIRWQQVLEAQINQRKKDSGLLPSSFTVVYGTSVWQLVSMLACIYLHAWRAWCAVVLGSVAHWLSPVHRQSLRYVVSRCAAVHHVLRISTLPLRRTLCYISQWE